MWFVNLRNVALYVGIKVDPLDASNCILSSHHITRRCLKNDVKCCLDSVLPSHGVVCRTLKAKRRIQVRYVNDTDAGTFFAKNVAMPRPPSDTS